VATITDFHAKYFAFELTKRSASDSMQKLASTLVDAQVDLNPHQVEAALFAFRSPLSMGAILADEVGLGKTIEACLVISQKWAERKRRILIITPANLRKQWSQELMDKFFLPSVILESKSFNDAVKAGNSNPFDQQEIILCSYQFARTKEAYLRQVRWDLAVIDEAHRLRNVYKASNKIAASIKQSLTTVPKILLTATPLQNSLLELYGLVSIIDDYAFGDLKSFKAQYSRVNSQVDATQFQDLKDRLKPICQRTLRRQVLEYIQYTNRIALVEEFYPSDAEQELYDLVSAYLQQDQLYALPPSQRKLMTLILRRLLASSTFAISATLGGLAYKLSILADSATDAGDVLQDVFLPEYEDADELADEWEAEDVIPASERESHPEAAAIEQEIAQLRRFEALAKSIEVNSKGEKLFTALNRGFQELKRLGAPQKAIIFTESIRTQEYLRGLLETRGHAGKVVLFNGTNNDAKSREILAAWYEQHRGTDKVSGSRTADMRAALVDFFRNEATIMVATEAAAEGINLQFCSLVINYDLPWNPQRIEQRIGRCHRYGQKFDVVVVNFLNKANAADVRVYQLLSEKFQLFDGVFGASDEVLGSIESGIDFERRIANIYQECRDTRQIEAAFAALQAELEGEISAALSQTRQQLLENFDEEVHEKLKINLRESNEYLNRYEAWLWKLSQHRLREVAEFETDAHAFSLRDNPYPKAKIHPGPYRIGKHVDDANVYRISHPLAQLVIADCKAYGNGPATVKFDYSGTPTKISILEDFVGQSGVLLARSFTVETFEAEDHVLLAGRCDDGRELSAEHCRRLFSLEGKESAAAWVPTEEVHALLLDAVVVQQNELLQAVESRNMHYFEDELEKLDRWGEDRRNSLKLALKDLDEEIKLAKKNAKLAPNLPEKLKLEKVRKQLEADRDEAWRSFDVAGKEIERSKDQLIDQIEQRLNKEIQEQELFLIRWELS
jgi:superfamily II DNA or RNA helicase